MDTSPLNKFKKFAIGKTNRQETAVFKSFFMDWTGLKRADELLRQKQKYRETKMMSNHKLNGGGGGDGDDDRMPSSP
ncbi:MAG: hypothetical protein GY737_04925 [Desulfobacteraceae bacterium]|nr:hypothetical protein [Desulfobacteraceae bacterium]